MRIEHTKLKLKFTIISKAPKPDLKQYIVNLNYMFSTAQ